MSSTPRSVRFHVPGLTFVFLAAVLALLYAPPAQAANPSAGNQAQLINAINATNGAGAGTHTITLTADISLTAALPALTNTAATEVVIDGDGHTLTGDAAHTILEIGPGAAARVRDVTLTEGHGDSGPNGEQGGAIYNRGRLTVENTHLHHNSAAGGGAIYTHGGAGNTAGLVLTHVFMDSNSDNGGQYGGGAGLAAVADDGTVNVTISQSIFRDHFATSGGGAIFLNGSGGEALLTMDTTAIVFNAAMGTGGGLVISSNGGVAAALLVNSTVAENESHFNGGGIAIYENGGTAELGLAFSTVNSNTMAFSGSAIFNDGGAITAAASIIGASGHTPACAVAGGGAFALTSSGYNLGDDGSCDLDAAGDIPNGQPLTHYAQPVAATYGETYVKPLDVLSDAQQVVPTGVLGCGTTVAQDQRGQPRPKPGSKCDIGAYESDAGAVCEPPLTASNEASLDAAIVCVNAAGAGTHTITLTADIVLASSTRFFNNSAATEIILEGGGHTLTGPDIVTIEPGTTVRVRNVTLTGGNGGDGGVITSDGTLTVENSQLTNSMAARGGAIFASGDVTIANSTFSDNNADEGGAVAVLPFVGQPATLTIRDSVIEDNRGWVHGGALYVVSSADTTVNIALTGVTIQRNQSRDGTGGIELIVDEAGELTATITGAHISQNTGHHGGLGLISDGLAEVTLARSTVAANIATPLAGLDPSAAGGVYVQSTTGGTASLTLFNSTLSGNSTPQAGGGLLVVANGGAAGANVVYSTLAGNTAGAGGGGVHTTAAEGGIASVRLAASIVTNGDGAGPDCARPSGAIISTGFNLAGDGTCFLNPDQGDWPASPAGLLPLALNAPGSTPTHALSAGSLALDRVPPGGQGCGTAVAIDQRGAPRPQAAGGLCDIGAFERQPVAPAFSVLLPTIRGQ